MRRRLDDLATGEAGPDVLCKFRLSAVRKMVGECKRGVRAPVCSISVNFSVDRDNLYTTCLRNFHAE